MPEHVDDQIIVTEARSALAQDDAVVAGLLALADDVDHFLRGKELRLLDIDRGARPGHRHDEVGLAREECRKLDDVRHFGRGGGLVRLMDIGQDRHAEAALDRIEYPQALLQAGTAKAVDRRSVGLVEAGLENIGNAQSVE